MVTEEVIKIIQGYEKLYDYLMDFAPEHLRRGWDLEGIELIDYGGFDPKVVVRLSDYRCGSYDYDSFSVRLQDIHSVDAHNEYQMEIKRKNLKEDELKKKQLQDQEKERKRLQYLELKKEFE